MGCGGTTGPQDVLFKEHGNASATCELGLMSGVPADGQHAGPGVAGGFLIAASDRERLLSE